MSKTSGHWKLTVVLRVIATFLFLNAASVLLPEPWIDSVLWSVGIQPLPDGALFRYLLRGSGVLLIAFGAFIWVLAGDVVRYRPLVVTIIAIFSIGTPASYLIGLWAGMPIWWRLLDLTICVLCGGPPLLILLRRKGEWSMEEV